MDKMGANVSWDEPNIFDNSQRVEVMKTHEFGFFSLGTTSVKYTAIDPSNNINTCILNITVEGKILKVQQGLAALLFLNF